MIFPYRRYLVCCAFVYSIMTLCASAELMERIQAGMEDIARGLDYVGVRAGQLLGPGIPLPEEEEAAFTHRHAFEEQYPTGTSPLIALSSEFGEVRVNTWDVQAVKITAEIVARAESEEVAEQLTRLIEVRVAHGEDYLECRTIYPEVRSSDQLSLSVNYAIQAPRDAGLAIDNFFGDVYLEDIGGMVVADVQYGGLELTEIKGRVRARVQGEFPVRVAGLRQGGVFRLLGADAEFSNIRGDVDIDHFRGRVTVRQIAEDARVTINSDSGRALIVLPPDATPDISAVIVHGRLESELDVSRTLRGSQLVARHPNADTQQRIAINAAFSEVVVAMSGGVSQSETTATRSEVFTDTQQDSIPAAGIESGQITVIPGNIYLEGVDTDDIQIEATRIVWTASAAAALNALDALELGAHHDEGIIQITTQAAQDMGVYDCKEYRVDLHIRWPRELPVQIIAEQGVTTVTGIGTGLNLQQRRGELVMEHIKGAIVAVNDDGDIYMRECSGPVEVTARNGSVSMERIYGDARVSAANGQTHIDAPQGALTVRHKNGNVRILSLEPIQGNFDILVENGDLNVFIAPDSDAAMNVKAAHGRVQSSLALSGTINRDFQEFFGRLNEENHSVRLESINGDIFLN